MFAFSEYLGSDWAADMARIAADPESQRWRQLTEPRQQPLPTAQSDEAWLEATEMYRSVKP